MIDLGAGADVGIFELDEIAHLGLVGQPGAGADARERADARARADGRALDMAEGMDGRAVGDADSGAEHHMRLDRDIAPKPGVECEPHAFGVDQSRTLVEHVLAPAALPFQFEMGELGAAVDARGFIGIALDHHRPAALARGDVDDIGQIIFARRIVVGDLGQPAEQIGRAHRHHPRIAQAHRAFFLGGVAKFDHLGDLVALAQYDPAIIGGVGGRGRQHDHARRIVTVQPVEHPAQRCGLDERGIAVEDQQRPVIVSQCCLRLLDRVPGAFLFGLDGEARAACRQRRLDLLAAFPDDHHLALGAKRGDAVEQMQQQRPAGDRVKYLVRVRTHPIALPRGKHDHGEFALVAHRREQWHGAWGSAKGKGGPIGAALRIVVAIKI